MTSSQKSTYNPASNQLEDYFPLQTNATAKAKKYSAHPTKKGDRAQIVFANAIPVSSMPACRYPRCEVIAEPLKTSIHPHHSSIHVDNSQRVLRGIQITRFNNFMQSQISVAGVLVFISDLVASLQSRIEKIPGVILSDIWIAGSTASQLVINQEGAFDTPSIPPKLNDIDFKLFVETKDDSRFDLFRNAVIDEYFERQPSDAKNRLSWDAIKEQYLKKQVRVSPLPENKQGDNWSLISMGGSQTPKLEFNFIQQQKRGYVFSKDSFGISLIKRSQDGFPIIACQYGPFNIAYNDLRNGFIRTTSPEEVRNGYLKYTSCISQGELPVELNTEAIFVHTFFSNVSQDKFLTVFSYLETHLQHYPHRKFFFLINFLYRASLYPINSVLDYQILSLLPEVDFSSKTLNKLANLLKIYPQEWSMSIGMFHFKLLLKTYFLTASSNKPPLSEFILEFFSPILRCTFFDEMQNPCTLLLHTSLMAKFNDLMTRLMMTSKSPLPNGYEEALSEFILENEHGNHENLNLIDSLFIQLERLYIDQCHQYNDLPTLLTLRNFYRMIRFSFFEITNLDETVHKLAILQQKISAQYDESTINKLDQCDPDFFPSHCNTPELYQRCYIPFSETFRKMLIELARKKELHLRCGSLHHLLTLIGQLELGLIELHSLNRLSIGGEVPHLIIQLEKIIRLCLSDEDPIFASVGIKLIWITKVLCTDKDFTEEISALFPKTLKIRMTQTDHQQQLKSVTDYLLLQSRFNPSRIAPLVILANSWSNQSFHSLTDVYLLYANALLNIEDPHLLKVAEVLINEITSNASNLPKQAYQTLLETYLKAAIKLNDENAKKTALKKLRHLTTSQEFISKLILTDIEKQDVCTALNLWHECWDQGVFTNSLETADLIVELIQKLSIIASSPSLLAIIQLRQSTSFISLSRIFPEVQVRAAVFLLQGLSATEKSDLFSHISDVVKETFDLLTKSHNITPSEELLTLLLKVIQLYRIPISADQLSHFFQFGFSEALLSKDIAGQLLGTVSRQSSENPATAVELVLDLKKSVYWNQIKTQTELCELAINALAKMISQAKDSQLPGIHQQLFQLTDQNLSESGKQELKQLSLLLLERLIQEQDSKRREKAFQLLTDQNIRKALSGLYSDFIRQGMNKIALCLNESTSPYFLSQVCSVLILLESTQEVEQFIEEIHFRLLQAIFSHRYQTTFEKTSFYTMWYKWISKEHLKFDHEFLSLCSLAQSNRWLETIEKKTETLKNLFESASLIGHRQTPLVNKVQLAFTLLNGLSHLPQMDSELLYSFTEKQLHHVTLLSDPTLFQSACDLLEHILMHSSLKRKDQLQSLFQKLFNALVRPANSACFQLVEKLLIHLHTRYFHLHSNHEWMTYFIRLIKQGTRLPKDHIDISFQRLMTYAWALCKGFPKAGTIENVEWDLLFVLLSTYVETGYGVEMMSNSLGLISSHGEKQEIDPNLFLRIGKRLSIENGHQFIQFMLQLIKLSFFNYAENHTKEETLLVDAIRECQSHPDPSTLQNGFQLLNYFRTRCQNSSRMNSVSVEFLSSAVACCDANIRSQVLKSLLEASFYKEYNRSICYFELVAKACSSINDFLSLKVHKKNHRIIQDHQELGIAFHHLLHHLSVHTIPNSENFDWHTVQKDILQFLIQTQDLQNIDNALEFLNMRMQGQSSQKWFEFCLTLLECLASQHIKDVAEKVIYYLMHAFNSSTLPSNLLSRAVQLFSRLIGKLGQEKSSVLSDKTVVKFAQDLPKSMEDIDSVCLCKSISNTFAERLKKTSNPKELQKIYDCLSEWYYEVWSVKIEKCSISAALLPCYIDMTSLLTRSKRLELISEADHLLSRFLPTLKQFGALADLVKLYREIILGYCEIEEPNTFFGLKAGMYMLISALQLHVFDKEPQSLRQIAKTVIDKHLNLQPYNRDVIISLFNSFDLLQLSQSFAIEELKNHLLHIFQLSLKHTLHENDTLYLLQQLKERKNFTDQLTVSEMHSLLRAGLQKAANCKSIEPVLEAWSLLDLFQPLYVSDFHLELSHMEFLFNACADKPDERLFKALTTKFNSVIESKERKNEKNSSTIQLRSRLFCSYIVWLLAINKTPSINIAYGNLKKLIESGIIKTSDPQTTVFFAECIEKLSNKGEVVALELAMHIMHYAQETLFTPYSAVRTKLMLNLIQECVACALQIGGREHSIGHYLDGITALLESNRDLYSRKVTADLYRDFLKTLYFTRDYQIYMYAEVFSERATDLKIFDCDPLLHNELKIESTKCFQAILRGDRRAITVVRVPNPSSHPDPKKQ